MPFVSKAQQRYMEWAKSKGKIKASVVKDFEQATPKEDYAKLPEHVKKTPKNEGKFTTIGLLLHEIRRLTSL